MRKKNQTGKLHHTFSGHFDEITGLVVLPAQRLLVTVSLDGTVRRWSLQARDLEGAKRAAEMEKEMGAQGEGKGEEGLMMMMMGGEGEEGVGEVVTEEEERELADLMEGEGG